MAAKTERALSFDKLWEALESVPEGYVGEIVGGAIRMNPRPAAPHLEASSGLGVILGGPFHFGFGGGPGGWVILDEPRIRFGDECRVPGLAGWRRERYIRPEEGPYEVVPDWVCELLSKSTAVDDRTEKLPLYAKHGVRHAWILDAVAQTLEVLRLEHGRWIVAQTFGGDAKVRAEPFEAIEIDLTLVWGPRAKPDRDDG
jgi:putative restriction endonuclease